MMPGHPELAQDAAQPGLNIVSFECDWIVHDSPVATALRHVRLTAVLSVFWQSTIGFDEVVA